METWQLIGVGVLISVLVRGCPDTAKQSTSPAGTQPLQAQNTRRESGLSSKTPSSLLKIPSISPVSPLPPKGIQDSSSQIPVIPPVGREASSRVIQQEPETNFDISRIQVNVPVDEEGRQNLINQGSDRRTKVNVLELPDIETERRPALENAVEPLSENPLNPALRSGSTTSNEKNVAPQNQALSSPVVLSSSESGFGRCNYSWEFDSAGNRCGDRAASERPNLNTGNAVGSYSAPIRSYSIPTSSYGSTYVRGYFCRDGTCVRGHSRRGR